MTFKVFTDDYLLGLLDQEDRRLHAEGKSLSTRQFQSVVNTCKRIGHTFSIGMVEDPLAKRIQELSRRFFRPKDSGAPSLFTGIMTHLGLLFQVNVPIVFGSVSINPFEHTDAGHGQLIRLNANKNELDTCLKQICDAWDIGVLLSEMDGRTKPPGRAGELFDLAAFHLMAGVTTASRGFASRGAVQSSLISAELAIKCAHLCAGKTEEWLQENVGHKLEKHLDDLAPFLGADYSMVVNHVKQLPPMVAERYGKHHLSLEDVPSCVLAAQEVAAAIARSIVGEGYRDRFMDKKGVGSLV